MRVDHEALLERIKKNLDELIQETAPRRQIGRAERKIQAEVSGMAKRLRTAIDKLEAADRAPDKSE